MQQHGEDVAILVMPNCLCVKSEGCNVIANGLAIDYIHIALVKGRFNICAFFILSSGLSLRATELFFSPVAKGHVVQRLGHLAAVVKGDTLEGPSLS